MLVRIMGFRFMVFSFPHSGSTLPCLPEAAGLGAALCSCCWAGGTAPGWCWAACCPWQFPAPTAGLLLAMAAQGPEGHSGTRPTRRTTGRATPERGLPDRALPPPTADKMADFAEVASSPSGAEPTNPRGGAQRHKARAGEKGSGRGTASRRGRAPFRGPASRFLLLATGRLAEAGNQQLPAHPSHFRTARVALSLTRGSPQRRGCPEPGSV